MEHEFTNQIQQVLASAFGEIWEDIYDKSPLLQYLNIKTKSAVRGAKARGSFANIYAIYVLVEDYLANGFDKRQDLVTFFAVNGNCHLGASYKTMHSTAG